jgi:hypothetical protein
MAHTHLPLSVRVVQVCDRGHGPPWRRLLLRHCAHQHGAYLCCPGAGACALLLPAMRVRQQPRSLLNNALLAFTLTQHTLTLPRTLQHSHTLSRCAHSHAPSHTTTLTHTVALCTLSRTLAHFNTHTHCRAVHTLTLPRTLQHSHTLSHTHTRHSTPSFCPCRPSGTGPTGVHVCLWALPLPVRAPHPR